MTELEFGILDELNELLDRERVAILRGDIDAVGRILDEKEHHFRVLREVAETEADELQQVRVKIEHNQSLLESSMRGIKAVADRLATVQRVRESLEIYDRDGNRKLFDFTSGKRLEKRA